MLIQVNKERFAVKDKLFFLLKAIPVLAVVLYAGHYLESRFSIGIDDQKELCLPGDHHWFLIDHHDVAIWRGDLVAFYADKRMAPWFKDRQIFVKIATGVPGDTVHVNKTQTEVNGKPVAVGLGLSEKLGKAVSDFIRRENVPNSALWVTGTNPKSFDSRYWGYVYDSQVIGRAYPLPW